MNLQAPHPVKEQSDQVYRLLRKFRELLITQPDLSLASSEYVDALDRFDKARKELQALMRASLGTDG